MNGPAANGPGEPAAPGTGAGAEPGPSAEDLLAECHRQRRRALGWAAVSGILLAALLVATLVAAARDAYHGPVVFLIPVIMVINLLRLAQCLAALAKIRQAERTAREAQERFRLAGGGAP